MIASRGDMDPGDFDACNIPTDVWIADVLESDKEYAEGFRFRLTASNYRPAMFTVTSTSCMICSDNRRELEEIVRDRFIPLYKNALHKLEKIVEGTNDCLFFWDRLPPKHIVECEVVKITDDEESCVKMTTDDIEIPRVSFPTNVLIAHNLKVGDRFRWRMDDGGNIQAEDIEPLPPEEPIDTEALYQEHLRNRESDDEWT